MNIYKLDNTVKKYAWGSPEWIPVLAGKANPGKEPWAELWMGIHNEGPSETEADGKRIRLGELIAQNPAAFLGEETAATFGNLPFLLKFLAADSPLSIQVHPDKEQAETGWERENRAGIALSAPERNYKDANHKPEIICALTPFTAMAGFRNPDETETLISAFFSGAEGVLQNKLLEALRVGYRKFLSVLFGLEAEERKALTALAAQQASAPFKLCGRFAGIYPGDPGIISPLYLNVIELEPFQAVYLPAGILHAYVHGLGVECMANSDNVLRGGLTPKHVDFEELSGILSFEPYRPEILTGSKKKTKEGTKDFFCRYDTPAAEFTLYRLESVSGGISLAENGAAIVVTVRGETALVCGKAAAALKQGEAAFIPRRKNGEVLSFTGDCALFAALAP